MEGALGRPRTSWGEAWSRRFGLAGGEKLSFPSMRCTRGTACPVVSVNGAPWSCAVLRLHIPIWSHSKALPLLSPKVPVFRPPAMLEIAIITLLLGEGFMAPKNLLKYTQKKKKGRRNAARYLT